MKKSLFACLAGLLLSGQVLAAGGEVALQPANNDLSSLASLQNGAKIFVNYCLSCHSAEFMRFSRMGQDLKLTDEQLKANMMFAAEKVGESLSVSMDKADAKRWFGVTPPDLSVIARARGTDWLYTYMLSFYRDDTRPWGVNNLVFKDVGMPHVLWELQGGVQEPVYVTEKDAAGHEHQVLEKLELPRGNRSEAEHQQLLTDYRRNVRDLVNFLEYLGEPAKLERRSLGAKVIAFLFIFLFVAYLLKKEYWRDVH